MHLLCRSAKFGNTVTYVNVKNGKSTNELEDVAKELFRQNIAIATWLLLTDYGKMQKERDKLKNALVNIES